MACAKSGEARLRGGGRWWRRKAAAFERGAWVVGGEAGMEASGQAGEACRWRAAWERAGLARARTWRCGLTRPIERKSRELILSLICGRSLRLIFLVAAITKFLGASVGSSLF